MMADLSTGAVPALLPFLVIEGVNGQAAPRSRHPGRVGAHSGRTVTTRRFLPAVASPGPKVPASADPGP